MLREDFENHQIWQIADEAMDALTGIEDVAQKDEQALLKRIRFLMSYANSFRATSGITSEFVNEALVAPATAAMAQISTNLRQRASSPSYRNYTDNALVSAENLLVALASWPRPFAKGAQAQQLKLLYEEIRVDQIHDMERMEAKYNEVANRMDAAVRELLDNKTAIEGLLEQYRGEAGTVAATVDQQKERIDKVVNTGLEKVNGLMVENTQAFEDWAHERESEWSEFADSNKDRMDKAIDNAANSLAKLKKDEKEFANLTTAITGQKLATEFNEEAKTSHLVGLVLYGVGFLALGLAAIPLFMLMGGQPADQTADVMWQHFAIRLSVGVLGASAATVLIRLGAKFLNNSGASKRMALELQTFGPFLANVRDQESVDAARLELIDRAFGKSYAPNEAESSQDAVPVSTLAQIVDMVKALK